MDYEKKYNNALERAKHAIEDCGDNQGRKEMIYGIFPQLKENDDERIRKFILETIFRYYGDSQEYLDTIAYLEKQKEQKPHYTKRNELFDKCVENCNPEVMKEVSDNIDKILEPKIAFGDWGDKEKQEAIITCLKYMRFVKKITNQEYDDLTKWLNDNLVSNVLEKDGWTIANEQTDTIKEDYYGAFLRGEMRGYLRGIKQKEQKPTVNIDNFKSFMMQYLQDAANRKTDSEIEADTDKWAKKLLNLIEVKKQKPAEWSEEDEFFRRQLIIYCENCVQDTLAAKCVDWLKSLRPQPQWKPSEEQMKIFNEAVEHYSKHWDNEDIKILCSLYDDLKKL